MKSVYLDHHATTPVDPRVVEAMAPCWTENFGNAGSISHIWGHAAAESVERARADVANALGVSDREVVFTSGATESNNLAIFGVAQRQKSPGHVLTLATEHKAVLDPVEQLGRRGWRHTILGVQQQTTDTPDVIGQVDLDQFADALRDDTILVSVMLANNEIGVLQPIPEIAALCRDRGIILHCDATQAVGKMPVDLAELGADLVSFSAHKMYGPKGVGALIVCRRSPRIRLTPQIVGGGQEGGRRSGTLNVPGIVGLAAALTISLAEMSDERTRLTTLRDALANQLRTALPDIVINGPDLVDDVRLPGNLNCSFPGVDGEALMMNMPRLAASSGSACTSANPEPSHVLRALGLSDDLSRASLRFGLGRFNTEDDIEFAAQLVNETVQRLRKLG